MPQRVVNLFVFVQVQPDDRAFLAMPGGEPRGLLHAVLEKQPVRQSGEGVVLRLKRQPLIEQRIFDRHRRQLRHLIQHWLALHSAPGRSEHLHHSDPLARGVPQLFRGAGLISERRRHLPVMTEELVRIGWRPIGAAWRRLLPQCLREFARQIPRRLKLKLVRVHHPYCRPGVRSTSRRQAPPPLPASRSSAVWVLTISRIKTRCFAISWASTSAWCVWCSDSRACRRDRFARVSSATISAVKTAKAARPPMLRRSVAFTCSESARARSSRVAFSACKLPSAVVERGLAAPGLYAQSFSGISNQDQRDNIVARFIVSAPGELEYFHVGRDLSHAQRAQPVGCQVHALARFPRLLHVRQLFVRIGHRQSIEKSPAAFLCLIFQVAFHLGASRVHSI